MRICLDIPDQYLVDSTPSELGQRLKLYAAVLMYRSGELSAGAACELAGTDRFTFLDECHRHGVATIGYAPEELDEELPKSKLL